MGSQAHAKQNIQEDAAKAAHLLDQFVESGKGFEVMLGILRQHPPEEFRGPFLEEIGKIARLNSLYTGHFKKNTSFKSKSLEDFQKAVLEVRTAIIDNDVEDYKKALTKYGSGFVDSIGRGYLPDKYRELMSSMRPEREGGSARHGTASRTPRKTARAVLPDPAKLVDEFYKGRTSGLLDALYNENPEKRLSGEERTKAIQLLHNGLTRFSGVGGNPAYALYLDSHFGYLPHDEEVKKGDPRYANYQKYNEFVKQGFGKSELGKKSTKIDESIILMRAFLNNAYKVDREFNAACNSFMPPYMAGTLLNDASRDFDKRTAFALAAYVSVKTEKFRKEKAGLKKAFEMREPRGTGPAAPGETVAPAEMTKEEMIFEIRSAIGRMASGKLPANSKVNQISRQLLDLGGGTRTVILRASKEKLSEEYNDLYEKFLKERNYLGVSLIYLHLMLSESEFYDRVKDDELFKGFSTVSMLALNAATSEPKQFDEVFNLTMAEFGKLSKNTRATAGDSAESELSTDLMASGVERLKRDIDELRRSLEGK